MNKDKLKEIIKSIQEVNKELGLKPKDDMILEVAQRIYVSEFIDTQSKTDPNTKPTEKQIAILNKNNIPLPECATRNEVSIIIKELFKSMGTQNG